MHPPAVPVIPERRAGWRDLSGYSERRLNFAGNRRTNFIMGKPAFRIQTLLALVVLCACSSEPVVPGANDVGVDGDGAAPGGDAAAQDSTAPADANTPPADGGNPSGDASSPSDAAGDDSASPPDAGPSNDAGEPADSAAVDAAPSDVSPADAAVEDAAPPDAGPVDTGVADAAPPDSGPADSGPFTPPQPDDCITDVSPGEREIKCEGYKFDISVPDICVKQACGLVFDVHGLAMSGDIQDQNTGMRALGRKHGYIVVQPNANPGPPTGGWYPKDYPPVWAFFERMARVFRADRKRLHITGFSQGGRLTWNMLCDHADVLASVAPAAYGMEPADPCSKAGGKTPAREIPVLYMHGTKDSVRRFGEAEIQRDNIIDDWKMTKDGVVSQDSAHIWTRYKSPGGNVFEFFQHDYQAESSLYKGHCIPGGPKSGGIYGFACVEKGVPNWPEKVFEFFIRHPRP
ncbi:MAG: hypothetical protein GMKNLPBB_00197 [Myxococcota bacterium]|nr:hypothetical protein [Myxococcota bacterium]